MLLTIFSNFNSGFKDTNHESLTHIQDKQHICYITSVSVSCNKASDVSIQTELKLFGSASSGNK